MTDTTYILAVDPGNEKTGVDHCESILKEYPL